MRHAGESYMAHRPRRRKYRLNVDAFFGELDAIRVDRLQSWREVARDLWVSPSLFTRMKKGHRPDTDATLALLVWSGLKLQPFIERTDKGE